MSLEAIMKAVLDHDPEAVRSTTADGRTIITLNTSTSTLKEEVTLVLPETSSSMYTIGLLKLSKLAHQHKQIEPKFGLGAEYSYALDISTDTFSMFPFYWGECTCGFDEEYYRVTYSLPYEQLTAWEDTHAHLNTCLLTIPNFHHFKSGLKINWYKYIGRSMRSNLEMPETEWATVIAECEEALYRAENK